MREPPVGVSDQDILAAVRREWPGPTDAVEHLAVGFGAHHWAVSGGGRRRLFVTLDTFDAWHTADSLDAAYAGAAALAADGLEFVVAPVPTTTGRLTTPLAGGALSATPWLDGSVVGEGAVTDSSLAMDNAAMLGRLHAAPSPKDIPVWRPFDAADAAKVLAGRLAESWVRGPYGEAARTALQSRQAELGRWVCRYDALAATAGHRPWVTTHGEPHTRNQLRTADGVRLVDWESLKLAPRERDLGPLLGSGYANLVDPNWSMVEMFDLEWRLAEITQYADWFAAAHAGTESDAVAYAGLTFELDRPDWSPP